MIEMTPHIDLRPDYLEIVCTILREHVPDRGVLAFGSRATWTAKEYSDLDLAVLGNDPLPLNVTSALTEGFSESDLPFKVDIVEWARIDETFRNKINCEGLVVNAPAQKNDSSNRDNLLAQNHKELSTKDRKVQREGTDAATNIEHKNSSGASLVFGDCANLIRQSVDPVGLNESIPYVGLEHISQEELQLNDIGKSTDVVSTKHIFRRGDILFGKLRPYFRKVIYAKFDGICSTDIWVIRPKEDFNSKFIFYWCASWDFVNYVNSSTEGTRMPRAKWEIACNHRVPNFTIDEQNAITHILGMLDEKIELNRRMNKTLEEMAQALFKSWFIDFDPVLAKMEGRDTGLPEHIDDLFPDTLMNSKFGEIPKGWESVTLGEIIDLNPNRTLRKGQVAPYLDMASMSTKGHIPHKWTDRPYGSGMRFTNGDTLLARITPCLENGKTAYVDFLPSGNIGWGSTEYIVMRPKPWIPNEFAYCLARSKDFREFAIHIMTGTSGRQRVPAKALAYFTLAAPSKEVLEFFGRLIRPLFAQASENAQESRTLTTLRDTLLPKLITGQIRLHEAETVTEAIS